MLLNLLMALLITITTGNVNSTVNVIDRHMVGFAGNATFYDPGNKHRFVMHDINSILTWLFIVRDGGRKIDEAWKRDYHANQQCNVFMHDRAIIHLRTIGIIKTDLIFKIVYHVFDNNRNDAEIATIELDKNYYSVDVEDLYLIIKVYANNNMDNFVHIEIDGYIRSKYMIGIIPGTIKWYIDNMLNNFGERLVVVK